MADADECNIKVVCRVRPMNSSELASKSTVATKFQGDDTVSMGVSCELLYFICYVFPSRCYNG